MAALESPPAAQKSVTGSRPRAGLPRAAWKARITPASDAGSRLSQSRPVIVAFGRLVDCGTISVAAGRISSCSERTLSSPRVSAGAVLDAGCQLPAALVSATAASADEVEP